MITAELNGVNVPVAVEFAGDKLLIDGEGTDSLIVEARYQFGKNGDLPPSSSDGTLVISTAGKVNFLTVTYRNGDGDEDGATEEQAIAIGSWIGCDGNSDLQPIAVDDFFKTWNDDLLNGDVVNNRTGKGFPGNAPLSIVEVVSDASNGTLTFNNDGTFSYDANYEFMGVDQFTYRIVDADDDTATAEIYIFDDADNDGLGDLLDIDDDNDGILDVYETCGIFTHAERTITIEILTDNYPYETSWTLHGTDGKMAKGGKYKLQGNLYTHTFTIHYTGQFKFTIKDKHKDGMSDGTPGTFVVKVDNDVVFSGGGNFGKKAKKKFKVNDRMFRCLQTNPSADDDGIVNYRDCDYCVLDENGVCVGLDYDGDGIPNFMDLDSDNDCIPDNIEGQHTIIYGLPHSYDTDHDGMDDAYDHFNEGVRMGSIGLAPVNTDGTDQPDYLDADSDNDGISDHIEGGYTPAGVDNNNNGLDDGAEGALALTSYGDPNGLVDDPKLLPDEDVLLFGGDVDFRDMNNAVLPVELVNFNAEAIDNDAHLNWQTASEVNNDHFLVEKSTDAIHWEVVGQVDGHGTTTDAHSYDYVDNNLANGVYYYRLNQIDFDGQNEYSPIRSILISGEEEVQRSISVYPNPVQSNGQVSIKGLTNEKANIRIFSIDGQNSIQVMDHGSTILDISKLELNTGTYIIQIEDGGHIHNQKILIYE